MQARNLTNIILMPDGAFKCDIELFDAWSAEWSVCEYAARTGDPAPVNQWVLDEIASGTYEISVYVPPPPPVAPEPVTTEPTVL